MSAGVQGFECIAIHVRHSVASCVARHRKREDPVCATCSVGAEHAAGSLPTHWPESRGGGLIVRLTIVPFDRIPGRRKRKTPRHD